jgi:hypothetical protein
MYNHSSFDLAKMGQLKCRGLEWSTLQSGGLPITWGEYCSTVLTCLVAGPLHFLGMSVFGNQSVKLGQSCMSFHNSYLDPAQISIKPGTKVSFALTHPVQQLYCRFGATPGNLAIASGFAIIYCIIPLPIITEWRPLLLHSNCITTLLTIQWYSTVDITQHTITCPCLD